MSEALGFVTHYEIEALLGGEAAGARRRRRLVERGWLPKAPMLRAGRYQLAIYPEFALAALVVPASSPDVLKRLVTQTAHEAAGLYRSAAFRRLQHALIEGMGEAPRRDIVSLIETLFALDRDAVFAWRDEVRGHGEALAGLPVFLDASWAQVVWANGDYVLRLVEAEAVERHPREGSPNPLRPGHWVTRDRVRVGSIVRDFLLPMPDPSEIGLDESTANEGADEEHFARALFDGLQGQVRVGMTGLPAAREPEDRPEPVEVPVPWELLSPSANSMTRSVRRT